MLHINLTPKPTHSPPNRLQAMGSAEVSIRPCGASAARVRQYRSQQEQSGNLRVVWRSDSKV